MNIKILAISILASVSFCSSATGIVEDSQNKLSICSSDCDLDVESALSIKPTLLFNGVQQDLTPFVRHTYSHNSIQTSYKLPIENIEGMKGEDRALAASLTITNIVRNSNSESDYTGDIELYVYVTHPNSFCGNPTLYRRIQEVALNNAETPVFSTSIELSDSVEGLIEFHVQHH